MESVSEERKERQNQLKEQVRWGSSVPSHGAREPGWCVLVWARMACS